MDDKMSRFLQKEAEKQAMLIEQEVNSDPKIRNMKAPESVDEKLYARIHAYEAEKERNTMSEENKELIELGKKYKRRKKLDKWIALVAVLVLAMLFGMTSVGGPEKILEKVKWVLGGNEQTNIDSDNQRVKAPDDVSEEEAYQEIENLFGFTPVKLYYLPEGMEFQNSAILPEVNNIQIVYEREGEDVISYSMWPNYVVGSVSNDIEDGLVKEYVKTIDNVLINIKHYCVEENSDDRWVIEFEYKTVYYFLRITNLDADEVEQIVENLYFL